MMPPDGTLPDGIPTGNANNGAEIDIIEANEQADRFSTSIHWDGYGDDHKSSGQRVDAPGLHKNYHTFTLQWSEKYLRFYYDGVKVREVSDTNKIPNVPEYIIASGGIFSGGWVDGDIETSKWPDKMFIDYVRVWRYI